MAPSSSDDLKDAVEAQKRDLREAAGMLYAVQKRYGGKVRERSKRAYGRMLDAHLLTAGVLGSALMRIHGKIVPVTKVGEERDALFASFVIGMVVCESAIEEGRYLQAHALLRQEMETLAQLVAVRDGLRNEEGAPNVRVLEGSIRRLYGDLSAAAHLSKHYVVRSVTACDVSEMDVPGPTSGTRYFPDFDESLARRLFALHLMLTIQIISELSIDMRKQNRGDGFAESEVRAVNLAIELIRIEGMVEVG